MKQDISPSALSILAFFFFFCFLAERNPRIMSLGRWLKKSSNDPYPIFIKEKPIYLVFNVSIEILVREGYKAGEGTKQPAVKLISSKPRIIPCGLGWFVIYKIIINCNGKFIVDGKIPHSIAYGSFNSFAVPVWRVGNKAHLEVLSSCMRAKSTRKRVNLK